MQARILLLTLITTTGAWAQQPFLLRKDIIVSQQSGGGATAGPTMVADFNGDGRADIAVCNAQALTILLNTGGGNFRSVVPGIDACAGVAADINTDGRADLVAGNVLRLSQGDGTFLPPRTVRVDGLSPRVVSAGDFNGDRKLDLLFYTGSLGWEEEPPPVTMHMMLGDGEGGFSESWRIVNPPARALGAAIAGDFNRDGNIDLTANSGEGILVFPGQGNGTFRSPLHTVNGEDSNNLVAGDFNRDGILDLGSAVSIALGKGDGTFQPPIRHGLSATRSEEGIAIGFLVSAAADFNNDGHLDLAGALFGLPPFIQTRVSVLPGSGDGTLLPPVHFPVGLWPQGASAGDFDGDGRVDLAAAGPLSNTLSLLLSRAQAGPAMNRAVSAASRTAIVSAESLATLFLPNLAISTAQAQAPWPVNLGGIGLEVRDANGAVRLAPLLYVSPTQINFQVPAGTALGEATLTILDQRGATLTGSMQVDSVAPGIFVIEGQPIPFPRPAATAVRLEPDGSQTNLALWNCATGRDCFPVSLPEADGRPIFLSLFGTGFRASGPSRVMCSANGEPLALTYAGPQSIPGVDQINIRVPRGQPGVGTIVCSINGVVANPVWL